MGSLWSGELLTSPGVVDCKVTSCYQPLIPPFPSIVSWTQSNINILHTPELWLVINGWLCPVWSDRQIIVILYEGTLPLTWQIFRHRKSHNESMPPWSVKVMHIFVLGVHLPRYYTLTKVSAILIEIRDENIKLISWVHWSESNSRVGWFYFCWFSGHFVR